ncbi:LacI family DNA-binding transcriptional regulator [Salinimicrobium sp. MT39]|uniref:LacI family DNA-binding transcriptional regulator n=1 Tax=Salinimicrobium profundisediminis TaxID=2994553 RepID=A0A9X3CWH7_9FLAO|nr:LacI family DNA-binding transcriptional regulator [Salinimicrobium profundisediminis]MCX2838242.1 LacI family DNA-binding transcriptional regulator [Salinimicrobium profundisediminis]
MKDNGKVTIYDISKRLNVSAATVSRALNNNPKISSKTRELVFTTAKEMNYKQNRLAQALKSGKSKNVGVIVPYINRNFFSSIIRGIEEELGPHGYHVIICQTHEQMDTEMEQINTLLNTQVDGIFMSISKSTTNIDHFTKVLQEGKFLIFFDRKLDVPGVSSVVIDDFKAGYMSTAHLISQGCKRIAHFSGDLNLEIYKNRHDGYISALENHGLKPDPRYIFTTLSNVESGAAAARKMWELKEKPDAVFSASDYTALGAVQELKKQGVRIPEDFCISGFSNEPFTQYMELPMSSIDQTPLRMGQIAAQVFLEQVDSDQELSIEKKVVLSPELMVRKSSNRSLAELKVQ